MRKILAIIIFLQVYSIVAWAQHNVFSVGSTNTLTIKSNTIFSADSLVLTPGNDLTLSSNAILETPVPILGVPNNGITRVYYLNSPITFTGTLQIYYQLSELNGNPESILQYYDSTIGRLWWDAPSSTVNTSSHYVQYTTSNWAFIAATAAESITILPLRWISFTGAWDQNYTRLSWLVDQNKESSGFSVESSLDGQNWLAIGNLPAIAATGQFTYVFNDADEQFSTKLYRIKMTELSGKISYSSIIKISKFNTANNIRVLESNNTIKIYFTGDQPKYVRVINAIGQTIWRDNISRARYELNNLTRGIYFIQYELNGKMIAKQISFQ